MKNLWKFLEEKGLYEELKKSLKKGELSLAPPSWAFLLAFLYSKKKSPTFLLALDGKEATWLREELSFLLGRDFVYVPEPLSLPWEESSFPSPLSSRLSEFRETVRKPLFHLIPLSSALLLFPPHSPAPLRLRRKSPFDLYEFLRKLDEMGYKNNFLVEREGEYSHRGSLVDVFSPQFTNPVRIDFSFDEISSIREFSLETQRSLRELEEVEILPLREAVVTEKELERIKQIVEVSEEIFPLQGSSGWGVFWPYLYSTSLEGIIPQEASLVLTTKAQLEKLAERTFSFWGQSFEETRLEKGLPSPPCYPFISFAELLKERFYLELSPFSERSFSLSLPPLSSWSRTLEEVRELLGKGFEILFIGEEKAVEESKKELSAEDVDLERIRFFSGRLAKSFILPSLRLAFVSLYESHPRRRIVRVKRKESPYLPPLDLRKGDLVVHEHHGIGEFLGMEKILIDGVYRDYLVVKYADGILKVPAEQVGRLTRYYWKGEEKPSLSKLTTLEWSRKKERARRAAKKLAINLLRLYAKREATKGYAFPPDDPWQEELESSFPYEETPDQKRAIREVKKDMESSKPMDRLVFGDVGYGKTEVALRASFKAVLAGKQVVMLVPTTVLAEQHYETFRERLAPYPVRVEVLSRFTPPSRQRRILRDFAQGKVDILIGTHRLLSPDVKPWDLGLLIIDEEHRFGVEQKEKIKALKEDVDVLTLTATPIPRTLQMALSGIREVSVIETPPEARLPVVTFVGPYSEEKVKRAINKELARGGQIFYVYNRVQSLPLIAERLKSLVPQARIALAHGQLKEDELESVMWEFAGGEYDLLLCTTIIESGLDLPNVNTLIVEGAEKLGLAQAYQLRGRVGRSERQAYAYFFFAPQALTEDGWQRLRTLSELADLGSGLKLALKDLEIRGAGTLFGPEQHGHIQAVGFDLYTQLVREAMDEVKGEEKRAVNVEISLPLPAFLPSDYISDSRLRIEFYYRLDKAEEVKSLKELEEELRDRFGELPGEVRNLLWMVKLKLLASQRGIRFIRWKEGELRIGGPRAKDFFEEMGIAGVKRLPGERRVKLAFSEAVSLLEKAFGAIIAGGD